MSEFVKYEDIDHIRVIRIDRPEKKNAVNDEMLLRISDLIEEVEGNSAIKCIIITSVTDKIFSSGYDISSENVDTKENILRVNIIDYSPNENSFQRISYLLLCSGNLETEFKSIPNFVCSSLSSYDFSL